MAYLSSVLLAAQSDLDRLEAEEPGVLAIGDSAGSGATSALEGGE